MSKASVGVLVGAGGGFELEVEDVVLREEEVEDVEVE